MDNETQLIPFIHNYCDRWCERCEFTSRCAVFAAEQEMTDEEKDVTHPAFIKNLKNLFADMGNMLREKALEFGIDLDAVDRAEYAASRARERAIIKSDEITKLAEMYAKKASQILGRQEEWRDETSTADEIQAEVIEVLYWYFFFISAKVQRGVRGILDDDGGEDSDQLNDTQSDANGSIKIALIAIERSILAWTYLLTPQNADIVRPMIELLENIREKAEQKFPKARDFVRPGFDEIEILM